MLKIILLPLLLTLTLFSGSLSITGTVVSDNQEMIGARYMGYVKNIYFNIGDSVKREDTLFELESAEFDIMENQADLALEQAEIMVDNRSLVGAFPADGTIGTEIDTGPALLAKHLNNLKPFFLHLERWQ
jgi:multidrug efflux pump subunit AcrA (membrane-fusion protein)